MVLAETLCFKLRPNRCR